MYEQDAKKAGKASFAYAWVLDETGEERERRARHLKQTKVLVVEILTSSLSFIGG